MPKQSINARHAIGKYYAVAQILDKGDPGTSDNCQTLAFSGRTQLDVRRQVNRYLKHYYDGVTGTRRRDGSYVFVIEDDGGMEHMHFVSADIVPCTRREFLVLRKFGLS